MQELLDGISEDLPEDCLTALNENWTSVAGFIVGVMFFWYMTTSGGPFRRLIGLTGLGFLAWELWRYASAFTND